MPHAPIHVWVWPTREPVTRSRVPGTKTSSQRACEARRARVEEEKPPWSSEHKGNRQGLGNTGQVGE